MYKQWLSWINRALVLMTMAFLLAAAGLIGSRPSEIPIADITLKKTVLPRGPFAMSKDSYDAIAASAFALKASPPSMMLPDLRQHLTYYGTNGRPDAAVDKTLLHFALANNKLPGSTVPGERLYLFYDKTQSPPRYVFSPNNAETSLWVEVQQEKTEAIVKVSMKNEFGEVVREPNTYAEFNLQEKEFARFTGNGWDIGKWRVDGSLLARQRARWHGADLFLEKHGGEEFDLAQGKQRIDFGEGDEVYSCFIAQGDNLIWEDDRWQTISQGRESRGKPLLHLKKVDERLINFELWDIEGKSRIVLNLIKSTEPWMPQNIMKDFKFIGARTRTQCAFEINQERMILKPKDWLLLTQEGWVKLSTPQEIDDYVNRKTTGALFVFDGLLKKEDKQMLVGTMYNAARTEIHNVELAVQQSNVSIVPGSLPEGLDGTKAEQQAKILLPKVMFPDGKG